MHGAPATPRIIDGLRDPSFEVRALLCLALDAIGPQAFAAIPSLLQVARSDDHAAVRLFAARALLSIAPDDERVVEAIATLVSDPHPPIREAVLNAAAERPGAYAGLLPLVDPYTADADPAVAAAASRAIAARTAVMKSPAASPAAATGNP